MDKKNDEEPRVHDLVLLRSHNIASACVAQPSWVKAVLEKSPWVVVRRKAAFGDEVAVGVRGNHRQQRWGGYVAQSEIVKIASASGLRSSLLNPVRRSLPALRALQCIERRLADLDLLWGPTGSVGFELATGQQITRPSSDLDLVIYAHQQLDKAKAKSIWAMTNTLPGRVDVKVETPFCGFSLEEYVDERSSAILLRMPNGYRLGLDPWAPATEEGY